MVISTDFHGWMEFFVFVYLGYTLVAYNIIDNEVL